MTPPDSGECSLLATLESSEYSHWWRVSGSTRRRSLQLKAANLVPATRCVANAAQNSQKAINRASEVARRSACSQPNTYALGFSTISLEAQRRRGLSVIKASCRQRMGGPSRLPPFISLSLSRSLCAHLFPSRDFGAAANGLVPACSASSWPLFSPGWQHPALPIFE